MSNGKNILVCGRLRAHGLSRTDRYDLFKQPPRCQCDLSSSGMLRRSSLLGLFV